MREKGPQEKSCHTHLRSSRAGCRHGIAAGESQVDGNAGTEPWRPFRVDLDFNDTDYAALEKILQRHERQYQASSWAVFGTGFAVAFLGAWLAARADVVPARDGGLIVVLIFAGFYIGIWSPYLWATRSRSRFRKEYRKWWFEGWRDASIIVRPQGIFIRTREARGFYRRSAIAAATLESGFVLLWRKRLAGEALCAIPARSLTPEQKGALLSLAARTEP